jgi:hypothetical protein
MVAKKNDVDKTDTKAPPKKKAAPKPRIVRRKAPVGRKKPKPAGKKK